MDEYVNPYKVYVSVTAEYSPEGTILPFSFVWENGHRYFIDKILDVRPAASLKAGGAGLRYTCIVQGKQTYLFFEDDRWFMERKET
ncbi:MAG: hypothetical protein N2Z65_01410 [Clostridiales bacterium]|nr:hypothetical protein [Clostridiales bacterium]